MSIPKPNPFSFTDFEAKLVDEQPLTQFEIGYERIKLCKMFDYITNNKALESLISNLKGLENNPDLSACKQLAFQSCLYVFTHDVKFSECENVKKLFDYISQENNNKCFSKKQKKQFQKHFNSMYEYELYDDEDDELGDEKYWSEGETREH